MKRANSENIFMLKERCQETANVCTLQFAHGKGESFAFKAGQYVTVYFPGDRFGWQGKPYSISSVPGEGDSADIFSITVKRIGQFSGALHDLRVGDEIIVEGPTGYFYPEGNVAGKGDIVFLAAGIGIAPIFSLVNDMAMNGELDKRHVFLFYSNKTKADIVFLRELHGLADKHPHFKIIHALTREGDRRFSPEIIEKHLKKYLKPSKPPDNRQYFLCGSIGFVNDFWKGLKESGIPEERIATEAFY